MNRILILITVLLALLMTACGGATTPTPDTNEQTTQPTVATTPAPAATEVATAEPTSEPTTAPTIPAEATEPAAPTETVPVRGTPEQLPTETPPVRGTPEPLPTYVDDSLGLAVPLSPDLLLNSVYDIPSAYGEPVQLIDGMYEDRSDPNATLSVRILEDFIAYGDVDGNGFEDAVVPFVTNTGGSGNFVDIILVSGKSGTVGQLAATFLGDRVALQSITAEMGTITVNMITQGPTDPFCCPTLNVTVTYTYEDGTLTESNYIENDTTLLPDTEGLPDQISLDYDGFAETWQGEVVPFAPVTEGPGQNGQPQHYLITFDGQEVTREYTSPFEAQLRVFPVNDYRGMFDAANLTFVGEELDALRAVLEEQPEFTNEMTSTIPVLPIFNAAQVLHAKVEYYNFPGGSGIGFVTYYAQSVNPILNGEVFYAFQGLTEDGNYLITFFQPLHIDGLYDSFEEVPADFIEQVDTAEEWEAYRLDVQALLEDADLEAFTPDLLALRSMLTTLHVR